MSRAETVDDLKQRCVMDEDEHTGCWHWRGATTVRDGVPVLWVFDTVKDRARVMSGPLAVLELSAKRKPWMTMGWQICRCKDCVNPAHIRGGTRKEFGKWQRQQGMLRNDPRRIAVNRALARARSTMTPEILEIINDRTLSGRAVAAKIGWTEQHVSQVRTGKCGLAFNGSSMPGSSVFTLSGGKL